MPFEKVTVNRKNITKVESETLQRVNKTISALEVAIARCEYSDDKSKKQRERFIRYKSLHTALSRWTKQMLRRTKNENFDSRLTRLWEFVDICNMYQ